ncbi:DUF58 domain-containing protein [Endozoicomonas arenosclerae]|uniref:DUF58 domain-containing protein n=1 Tax=Endozoicomonas arenosclerae TaxID=1633495 RepID=UPI00156118CD|nr:DUF58 domain-containing protein [Endozoicomonas arenosclerae]
MKEKTAWARRRFNQWLDRRIPPSAHITLDQKRIFILPTIGGYIWLAVALLIFILAANYANSLAFGLAFFMISLFMLSILHTWRNLAGVTLISRSAESGHAGESIAVKLQLQAGEKSRQAVQLGWPENEQVCLSFDKNQDCNLKVLARTRGWLQPGRMRVESVYPLGFCRAWSWVLLEMNTLIYPRPDHSHPLPDKLGGEDNEGRQARSGHDDFAGFRRYKESDLAGHVDWKGFARTNELNTKLFEEPVGNQVSLSFVQTPGVDIEEKLSVLTGWCLSCESDQRPYSLILPGLEIPTGIGSQHLQRCLEALALYALEPNRQGDRHHA